MTSFRTIFLLVLTGCAEGAAPSPTATPTATPAATTEPKACVTSLQEGCSGMGLCDVTFAQATKKMKDAIADGSFTNSIAEEGTCGNCTYLMESGLGFQIRYFDADGKLVGGSAHGDGPSHRACVGNDYGLVPKCDRVVKTRLKQPS